MAAIEGLPLFFSTILTLPSTLTYLLLFAGCTTRCWGSLSVQVSITVTVCCIITALLTVKFLRTVLFSLLLYNAPVKSQFCINGRRPTLGPPNFCFL